MMIASISALLLQAAAGGGYGQILIFGAMFVVLYFFMIRPQQKKAKEQKAFLENLKVGDKVVTIGGLHGTIVDADALTITLSVDSKGNKLTFDRAAVSKDSSQKSQAAAEKAA